MKNLIIIIILLFPVFAFAAVCTENSGVDECTVCLSGSGCDYTQTAFEALNGTGYAGDTFYFQGTSASEVDVNIGGTSLSSKVTLDGWSGGTCDPPDTTCTSAANMDDAMEILTGNDYIIVQDFDFDDGSRAFKLPDNETVSGLELRNCTFADSSWSTLWLPVIEDFVIDNNNFVADRDYGHNILITAGKRGRITNNKTYGGFTSFILIPGDTRNGSGVQSRHEKIVIANNYFERSVEEGLSLDTAGDGETTPFHEYDTLSCVYTGCDPSITTSQVKLSHADWGAGGGADPNYIGLHMVFVSGALAGRHAEITGQSNAVFTLDTEGSLDFSDADPGDGVAIASVFRKNYIGSNTIKDPGYGGSALLLFGLAFENLVENNILTNDSGNLEINSRSLEDYVAHDGSVTGSCAVMPCSANLIMGNSLVHDRSTSGDDVQIDLFLYDPSTCSLNLHYYSYYNTVLDNTLDGYTERVYFHRQYGYTSGNVDGSDNPISSDTSFSIDNISWKVYWPYIIGTPEISADGNYVTVAFSESVDVSGYTTGDAWVEDADENKINLVYSSGDDTTSIIFSAQSTINTGTTWYFWFDGTDDSIEDNDDGNDLTVYGFKATELSDSPPGLPIPIPLRMFYLD